MAFLEGLLSMKDMSIASEAEALAGLNGISGGAGRPVDLVHLSRYTMGDRNLESELLGLFRQQARVYVSRMREAESDQDWHRAAHSLKGSAKAVGAWAVAQVCEGAESLGAGAQDARLKAIGEIEAQLDTATAYIDLLLAS